MEKTIELNCKINVDGLDVLDKFLNKHGDKVKLISSFELKPGDVLFFKCENPFSKMALERITKHFKKILPGVKAIFLEEIDLIGVGRGKKSP